jgi:serine protease AprX
VACCVAAAVAAVIFCTSDAQANGRRAHLSDDLRRQLAAGNPTDTDVILTGTRAGVEAIAARHGLRVRRHLKTGAVVDVPAGRLATLAEDPEVDQLSGNHAVRATLAVATASIGADQAWAGIAAAGVAGATGHGVGVAVIDSGVADVPALQGRLIARLDFTPEGRIDRGRVEDGYGHGTHVAGIIAASSPNLTGVAPQAHIVSLKVLGADGSGQTSDVIEAIDWAIEHKDRYRLRVINLSLGHGVVDSWQDDPLCQAVERAYRAGLVVVASAGNLGKLPDGRRVAGGITSPGNSPFAITVGALNTQGTAYRSDDEVAGYSSTGPTRFDRLIKPDLVAPGTRIRSLLAPNSTLGEAHPEMVIGTGPARQLELSGTSMAAAVVSGAAALLIDEAPAIRQSELRWRLQKTASRVGKLGLLQVGAGSLNVAAALQFPSSVPVTIAGEAQVAWGYSFSTRSVLALDGEGLGGEEVASGPTENVILGQDDVIIWGEDDVIIWGEGDVIIWGEGDVIIWGEGDVIIWGEGDVIIWGEVVSTQVG